MSNPFKMKDKKQMDQSPKGQSVTRVVLPSLQKAVSCVWGGWDDRREPPPSTSVWCQGMPGAVAIPDFWFTNPLKAFQEVCRWQVQVHGLES